LKTATWSERLLIRVGYLLLKIWARTLRFKIDDRAGVVGSPVREPYIWSLWHNRVLLFPYIMRRFARNREGAALISASRDGALLAEFVQHFGFEAVRGSSSRKGVGAMLQLADVVARGRNVAFTPDGPRGPVYELGAGIIFLAQKSGAPVIPVNFEYSGCWRLKSWDRFILPKPFSTVRVTFAPPHHVQATSTDDEFEVERLRLQNTMMELVETH
jgi:lysophospholipid acyltransferase (LPLAT)-like uncharacterized protein